MALNIEFQCHPTSGLDNLIYHVIEPLDLDLLIDDRRVLRKVPTCARHLFERAEVAVAKGNVDDVLPRAIRQRPRADVPFRVARGNRAQSLEGLVDWLERDDLTGIVTTPAAQSCAVHPLVCARVQNGRYRQPAQQHLSLNVPIVLSALALQADTVQT